LKIFDLNVRKVLPKIED